MKEKLLIINYFNYENIFYIIQLINIFLYICYNVTASQLK